MTKHPRLPSIFTIAENTQDNDLQHRPRGARENRKDHQGREPSPSQRTRFKFLKRFRIDLLQAAERKNDDKRKNDQPHKAKDHTARHRMGERFLPIEEALLRDRVQCHCCCFS